MGKDYTYRNLILWQRAQDLAYEVIQITRRLPQNWSNAVIARQIIASATSIAANIAEGHGRFSLGAHRNHLSIAKGSATETDSWLDLLRRDGLLDAGDEQRLHSDCSRIIGMLTNKIRELERLSPGNDNQLKEIATDYQVEDPSHPVLPYTEVDYIDN